MRRTFGTASEFRQSTVRFKTKVVEDEKTKTKKSNEAIYRGSVWVKNVALFEELSYINFYLPLFIFLLAGFNSKEVAAWVCKSYCFGFTFDSNRLATFPAGLYLATTYTLVLSLVFAFAIPSSLVAPQTIYKGKEISQIRS